MANNVVFPPPDAALVEGILKRVASDLSLVIGHDFSIEPPRIERAHARPAGANRIHISFKIAVTSDTGATRFGSMLVPLPDSIAMASLLLMIPDETVASMRSETSLDSTVKDAMLEIGNMIGGATNNALVELGLAGWSARSGGCQGVKPNVRPALPYQEGSELIVSRALAHVGQFPTFELILVLPTLG
jgi:hypothetical protein